MARFDGKVAFLTGAASGIGRAVAQRLAAEGAAVAGMDVNEAGLDETAELVRGAGGTMTVTVGDVSSRSVCHEAIDTAVAEHGRLDVLGNIAGIARSEHATDVTEEAWDQMVGVNLAGVFWCAQAAIPHLLRTDGNIVNIASNAGLMGQAYTAVYCATKGGVVNLTRALAMEYVKTGIRVNAIAPAGVATPLTTGFAVPDDIDFELMQPYVGFRDMSQPEDIAGLFAYLASEEAHRVHGAILSIDAGVTAG